MQPLIDQASNGRASLAQHPPPPLPAIGRVGGGVPAFVQPLIIAVHGDVTLASVGSLLLKGCKIL